MATYYVKINPTGAYVNWIKYKFGSGSWSSAQTSSKTVSGSSKTCYLMCNIYTDTAQYTYTTTYSTSVSSPDSLSGTTSSITAPTYKPTVTRTTNKYYVTVEAGEGGTASGSGYVEYNKTKTISASSKTGYTFSYWQKNGYYWGKSNPATTDAVTAAVTYKAIFTANTHTLTLAASPLSGGSVTGGGTKSYGQKVTVSANPASDYNFDSWSDGGAQSHEITMPDSDLTLTAYFTKKPVYKININVSGSYLNGVYYRQGSSGTYSYTTSSITLSSYSSTSYYLYCNIHPDDVEYTYSCNKSTSATSPNVVAPTTSGVDYTPVVTRSRRYYIITTETIRGKGTVTGGGSKYYGQSFKLTATPDSGYYFVKWSDGSTENPRSEECVGNATYEAIFWSLKDYKLVYTSTRGEVPDWIYFLAGQDVTLASHMTPVEETILVSDLSFYNGASVYDTRQGYSHCEYSHRSWMWGETYYTPGSIKTNMPAQNVTMSATWQAGTTDYDYITTPSAPTNPPRPDYEFTGWKGESGEVYEANTKYKCTLSDFYGKGKRFEAQWQIFYWLTVEVHRDDTDPTVGGGMVFIDSTGSSSSYSKRVAAGTYHTIKATPYEAVDFTRWSDGGAQEHNVAINKDTIITAYFTSTEVIVEFYTLIDGNYRLDGTRKAYTGKPYPDPVRISRSSYKFKGWSMMSSPYTMYYDEDYNPTGTRWKDKTSPFKLVSGWQPSYRVVVSTDSMVMGYVYGGGTYETGSNVTVNAVSLNDSNFLGWYDYSISTTEPISKSPRYTIEKLSRNTYLIAKFAWKVNISYRPSGTKYSSLIKLEKQSDDTGDEYSRYKNNGIFHYKASSLDKESVIFQHWLVSGEIYTTSASCKFTVTKHATAYAVFLSKIGDYEIIVQCNDPDHATCSGSGKYDKNEKVYISCTPDDGYSFIKWQNDGNKYSERLITVTDNVTYVGLIQGDQPEQREDDEGIDESPWYLPKEDVEGIGIPTGYNDYCGYMFNPITNYVYRRTHPEAEVVYSNCVWYAAGRTMELANRSFAGQTGCNGSNWFDCAYLSVDGKKWDREGHSDCENYAGEEITNISFGDILCWYSGSGGHVEIVEEVDYDRMKIKTSLGRYKGMTKSNGQIVLSDDRKCATNWIDWPTVNSSYTGETYTWGEVKFQGVIHNPYRSTGGRLKTIKMVSVPNGFGSVYVNGAESGSFAAGTEVTLSYEPGQGHTFKQWWDGNKENNRKYIVGSGNTQVLYAYFDGFDPSTQVYIGTHMVPGEIGEITGDIGIVRKGSTVTLDYIIYPGYDGYNFSGWSTGYTGTPLILENVRENMEITATFGKAEGGGDKPETSDYSPLYGEGKEIELKSIEFNIGAYMWREGSGAEYVRPGVKLMINGTEYQSFPESTESTAITVNFDPAVKTSDIKLILNGDYSSKNSIVFNTLKISYVGWDPYRGEQEYTRYYNGSKWTEWVKEE